MVKDVIALWSLRSADSSAFDKYLVLSSADETLVLSLDTGKLIEVNVLLVAMMLFFSDFERIRWLLISLHSAVSCLQ